MAAKPSYEELETEIARLKRLENALVKSGKDYRTILQTAIDGFAIHDLQGRMIDVNESYCQMLGYSREELLKLSLLDVEITGPPDEQAKRLKHIVEQGNNRFESQYKRKDGRILDVEISVTYSANINGNMFVFIRDITNRKQAEKELQESEEKYRILADNISDSIWTINLESGRFGYVSPSSTNLTGYSLEEYKDLSLQDLLPSKSLELAMGIISEELDIDGKEGIDPNRNRTIVLEQYRKDGSRIWIEARASFIRDKNGRPESILGVTRDITARKKAEEERHKLEEQLQQSQKMESIGTLAGGIAHEFNNILGTIIGNVELSRKNVSEESSVHYNLEEVLKAGFRARDMVKQILNFSQPTKQEAKVIRLGPHLEETLKLIRSTIPATIKIRQNLSVWADTIFADEAQINQILMNLCTNACHAMREREGILEVCLKNIDVDKKNALRYQDLTPGKYLALNVSDTGHGIEPVVVERIFDPYFTTKEVGEGIGMGLAVVHGIVKNHGGTIRVYSEPGQGTTFSVYFPMVESQSETEASSPEPVHTGTERILFVDDDESLADLGKRTLEYLGYDVTVKTCSIEALEVFKAQSDKYDLLLTDMTMPDMTGKELAQKFLKIRPGFPIILCTGFSETITKEKAEQIGIKAFVLKPLAIREIAETIRQALGHREEKAESIKGRILLVEDDDQLRKIVKQMLEDAGHEIVEAPNGKIAITQYREKPADLIITDLIMPEKEGLELIMELKRDFPEVKIIAVSGGGRRRPEEYLVAAKHLGVQRTLAKPFTQEEILKAVQDLLK